MVRKVSYIAMSEEDYEDLLNKIRDLENKLYIAELDRDCFMARFDTLYDALNRPALEAAEKAGNDEFYAWCNEMADKYEKLDEVEWTIDRARFYNNGMYEYAIEHCLENTCEEVERYRKYSDGCKHWYTTKLLQECDDEEDEVRRTEGWSEIVSPRPYKNSFVLVKAQNDIFDRYFHMSTGWTSEKYHKLWHSFNEIQEECGWDEFSR